MLPDRVSNPGPLTYESGALPIVLRGPAKLSLNYPQNPLLSTALHLFQTVKLFADLIIIHCIWIDSSTVVCWTHPFLILGVSGLFCHFYSIFDGKCRP